MNDKFSGLDFVADRNAGFVRQDRKRGCLQSQPTRAMRRMWPAGSAQAAAELSVNIGV